MEPDSMAFHEEGSVFDGGRKGYNVSETRNDSRLAL